MRLVTDEERRARLGVRHALAPTAKAVSPEEAARAVVCLHATDPPSVHLSCWARVDALDIDDVERALYDTRSLIRQQSMRETLFVFPRDLVPAVWGSASARVAAAHRKRLVRDLQRWGPAAEGQGAAWLATAEEAVLAHLADGVPRSSKRVREEVPEAAGFIEQAPDKPWGGRIAIAPRVLTQLSLDGAVARAANAGAWYTSRPTWTTTQAWWGDEVPEALAARQGYAELVSRWLWSYGPGTVDDLAWWFGATKSAVRTALDDIGAQRVSLEDGSVGWLRQDDLAPVVAAEPWVALLPLLDPSVMGWKARTFYLGAHAPQLFDSAGNAGTTAWVDGRVVGAWVQDPGGVVELRLLDDDVPPQAREALAAEARRLSAWLDGQRVFAVYPSPAMQPGAGR
ncbi:winged helix DNA-binding domain-containing protein [Spongiactinospora sp. TRM90649]|uniref:winged helix DNA-binding domain-containing protein n=1 Tax=Spongiactinospora sp. TRM90649 TaxID=3031114 RepID=UPI0023F7C93A|nr:winged helix DNA-binding domain-containing protein [Spongiactinospora sp. TRM90649]MDF5757327.1 winged helix DNA-binding domain-containing protein [Spongiactinospora sp. TRM90649]